MPMKDVDHTHPHTDETFGRTQTFRRGAVVAADGGRDGQSRTGETASDRASDTGTDETVADVEHDAAEGANRTFERGTEGRTDTV